MISNCNGKRITARTPHQIAEKYEKMAEEAEIDKDLALSHLYMQYADHWRRHDN